VTNLWSGETRIGTLHLHAGGLRRWPNLALFFGFILCCSIFCYGCMCALLCFSFSVLCQEIGWENASEI